MFLLLQKKLYLNIFFLKHCHLDLNHLLYSKSLHHHWHLVSLLLAEVVDAETMLATVRVARLAAYYEYDVALMNLLAICGTPERFEKYFETTY